MCRKRSKPMAKRVPLPPSPPRPSRCAGGLCPMTKWDPPTGKVTVVATVTVQQELRVLGGSARTAARKWRWLAMNNPSAFPLPDCVHVDGEHYAYPGMTLRDYFAARA